MKSITIETGSYNQRRYGKPWIALVNFSVDPKGIFVFGDWSGDYRNGGEGVLSISANVGDIVAKGQKDNRNPKYSSPEFYVVNIEGNLDHIGDKGAAYRYFLNSQKQSIDKEKLMEEKQALLTRLAEIDKILNA